MPVNPDNVRAYFDSQPVTDHYVDATIRIGLWKSEEAIFRKVFQDPQASLIDIGCGTGRIAIGLHELGYRHIIGVDLSKGMIREARRIAQMLDYRIPFHVGDATRLSFEDNLFDGAIFGFNGLMQIPGRANRQAALREIFRVLRPGAWFVFTTHDRDNPTFKTFWSEEQRLWNQGKQDTDLHEFGDRYEDTPLGRLFIHVPTKAAVIEDAKAAGFRIEADVLRSQVAVERPETREFSDDCRFWVVQKRDG
ncbi:MAG: class I SAM-dependent methyltransferase [Opitutales bacterium]